jgi:predicted PurR-regulated permease PerM
VNRRRNKDTAATAAKAAVEAYGPSTRVVLRSHLYSLIVVAVLWVISKITGIILLLVLSIFFAYLVSPLVEFCGDPRTIGKRTIAIPKVVAIALAYLIILAAIVFAVLVVLPSLSNQFPEFRDQAKSYWSSLATKTQQLIEYSRLRRLPAPVVDAVNNAVPK